LLCDLLAIFDSDERIGMVGMAGYDRVSADGIMWHARQLGGIYRRKPQEPYPKLSEYRYSLEEDGYGKAAEIDGLLMATAQDVPWDTGNLDGWDFYDAFQSIRFLEAGYHIAVPVQRHPWCLHDDNGILNLEHYDDYRQIFREKYAAYLGKNWKEIIAMQRAAGEGTR